MLKLPYMLLGQGLVFSWLRTGSCKLSTKVKQPILNPCQFRRQTGVLRLTESDSQDCVQFVDGSDRLNASAILQSPGAANETGFATISCFGVDLQGRAFRIILTKIGRFFTLASFFGFWASRYSHSILSF